MRVHSLYEGAAHSFGVAILAWAKIELKSLLTQSTWCITDRYLL